MKPVSGPWKNSKRQYHKRDWWGRIKSAVSYMDIGPKNAAS